MKMLQRFLSVVFVILLPYFANSQSKNDQLTRNYNNKPLRDIIKELEEGYKVKFYYIRQVVDTINVTASFDNEPLKNAVEIILDDIPLSIVHGKDRIDLFLDRRKVLDVHKYTLTGSIKNNLGQQVANAEVYTPGLRKTVVSDSLGQFKMSNLKAGDYTLRFDENDHYKYSETVAVDDNTSIDVKLTVITSKGKGKEGDAISVLNRKITLENSSNTVEGFLNEASKSGKFELSYVPEELSGDKKMSVSKLTLTVKELLDVLFKDTDIGFIQHTNKLLLKKKNPNAQKYTISGTIKDLNTGESLIGVSVGIMGTSYGTISNQYGFYSLTVPEWTYILTYSYIGYPAITKTVELDKNLRQDVSLSSEVTELQEFVVTDEARERSVSEIKMGAVKMNIKTIKSMPAFMGEADVVKSISMQPGITTVGEGSSGFNVRGGGIDQNLVILDEAPVYNSSHLFGFFSVFNPDVVKDVNFYKSGIPSRYGGRLSSVLDVSQKEGNNRKFGVTGGLGLVGSRLAIEGPLVKDKSSFIIAGRRSYVGEILQRVADDFKETELYFYDINAKINYKINDKNRIYLSGYLGKDAFEIGEDKVKLAWGNLTTTLRWNHLFSDKLFSNFTAVYSNYDYKQGSTEPGYEFEGESGIINYNLKADFTYYLNSKHTLDFGANGLFYQFENGKFRPENNSVITPINLEDEYAVEPAIYVQDEYNINKALRVTVGLRYSHYYNIGKGTVYKYRTDAPKSIETITDTLNYGQGDVIKEYGGFEPRFSVRYSINDNNAIQFGYDRLRQYIHFISNTNAATPLDIWKTSDKYLRPEISDQISLGYFRNLRNNTIEASVEVYYKQMKDLVDFQNGAELVLNRAIEADLLAGTGRAYGVEVMLNKTVGRLTGWVSYAYSKTERRVTSQFLSEKINGGEYYPSNYDLPNKVNLVAIFKAYERISLSANFTYNTGRPATYPDARYIYSGIVTPQYSKRNQDRLPDYHRLDLSVTLNGKPHKKWQSSWVLAVYNVYARKNAYSVFLKPVRFTRDTESIRLSILGAAFPSLTYNFKF